LQTAFQAKMGEEPVQRRDGSLIPGREEREGHKMYHAPDSNKKFYFQAYLTQILHKILTKRTCLHAEVAFRHAGMGMFFGKASACLREAASAKAGADP